MVGNNEFAELIFFMISEDLSDNTCTSKLVELKGKNTLKIDMTMLRNLFIKDVNFA